METKILRTRYGQPATATLAEVIRASKDGDPLAQMTVVVPDHTLGLTVRRQLAANASGLVAVDFITLLDLARRISAGSPLISSRRPVSDAVVLAATRRLLAERPGAFAPVADHPSVEHTVMATHRNLREYEFMISGSSPSKRESMVRANILTSDAIEDFRRPFFVSQAT